MICKYCGATFFGPSEQESCGPCGSALRSAEHVTKYPRLLAALTAKMLGILMEEKAAGVVEWGRVCPKCGTRSGHRRAGAHFDNEYLCSKCDYAWEPR